jgi:hypothetical protein
MAPPQQTAAQQHKDILDAYHARIEDMQKRFTLYFMGIEKRGPFEDREALAKELRRIRGESSRWSTGDRFRMNQLQNRFSTYDRMWQRTIQEMENGTYRRDVNRLKRKAAEEADAPAAGGADGATAPPETVRAAPAPRQAQNDDGLGEDRVRRLYNVYMQAKKRTGEATNLTYESLRAQLEKQIPAIKAKHNCASVDFKVVMKDGKAMLKAVPK